MTCSGCVAKVQSLLSKVTGVTNLAINLEKGEASINMANNIPTVTLKAALKDYPKYQLEEKIVNHPIPTILNEKAEKSWWELYKPILIIGAYISGIALLVELVKENFNWESWMTHFMAGFFLVFSFFKLLNLKGFAESYSMYDIIAKNWVGWGYVYAFTELALGVGYLLNFNPLLTNIVTFVVMTISIIGVLQSVMNKRKIQCACLGAVFNLPMSTVTIIEDALMIVMSGIMIITLFL